MRSQRACFAGRPVRQGHRISCTALLACQRRVGGGGCGSQWQRAGGVGREAGPRRQLVQTPVGVSKLFLLLPPSRLTLSPFCSRAGGRLDEKVDVNRNCTCQHDDFDQKPWLSLTRSGMVEDRGNDDGIRPDPCTTTTSSSSSCTASSKHPTRLHHRPHSFASSRSLYKRTRVLV